MKAAPRAFVTASFVVLVLPLVGEAQQAAKMPRVGVLWPYTPAIASPFADALREGLRGLNYVEGRTILLEERWAEGALNRLPSLAAELVQLNVDVMVTATTPAVQAAQQAT